MCTCNRTAASDKMFNIPVLSIACKLIMPLIKTITGNCSLRMQNLLLHAHTCTSCYVQFILLKQQSLLTFSLAPEVAVVEVFVQAHVILQLQVN